MENFIVMISLIVAVIISTIIQSYLPKVPLAFIQIGLGLMIFLTPIPIKLEFEPELFLIGIIAPLLFLEGNHVSRITLLKYLKPIILMAMGLVFITVIGLGYFSHALIPVVPLAACFALAAIICPTDAVAVGAIAKGKKLPKGLMTILEGESLLNDAAGILCFNIAVLALTTGEFSAGNAVLKFLETSIGGVLVGIIIGVLFVQMRIRLIRSGFENDYIYILIQLLTPFVIFMIAESFHFSGVIAAVMGGIIHGMERDRMSQATTRLQLGYDNTWGLLSTVLNGLVFVILGYLIPDVSIQIFQADKGFMMLLIYTIIIALILYIIRFSWVYLLYDIFYIPESRFERILNREKGIVEIRPSRFKYALVASVCGIHGTISMAIALTLPHMIHNQTFDARDELLFISAGVIVISLVVAQLVLPFITESEEEKEKSLMSYKEARIKVKEFGLKYINENTTTENNLVAGNLSRQYSMQISFIKNLDYRKQNTKEMDRLQAIAMSCEMETLDDLVSRNEITDTQFNNYVQYTERTRTFHSVSSFRKMLFIIKMNRRRRKIMQQVNASSSLSIRNNLKDLENIARIVHYNVVNRLSKEMTRENSLEVALISDGYLSRIDQLKRNIQSESIDDEETILALDVLGAEKNLVYKLVTNNKISTSVAVELRQSLNYDEMLLLNGYDH